MAFQEDRGCFGILNLDDGFSSGTKWLIGSIVNPPSAFSKKTIEIGVINASIMAKERHPLHHHKRTTEIYLVLEGKILIRLDNEKRKLFKYDLLCVSPNTPHRILEWSPDIEIVIIKDQSDPTDKVIVP